MPLHVEYPAAMSADGSFGKRLDFKADIMYRGYDHEAHSLAIRLYRLSQFCAGSDRNERKIKQLVIAGDAVIITHPSNWMTEEETELAYP